MLTHVSINSTLRDVLVKYRTVQRLVGKTIETQNNGYTQWLCLVIMYTRITWNILE